MNGLIQSSAVFNGIQQLPITVGTPLMRFVSARCVVVSSATKKRWISAAKTLFHDVVKLDAKAILLHKVARGGRRLPEPGERRGKLPIGQGAAAFRAAAGTMIRHKVRSKRMRLGNVAADNLLAAALQWGVR